jgi:hypothetical protein
MHSLQVVTFLLLLPVEQPILCNIKLAVRVLYIAKLTPQDNELMYLSYKNVVHSLPRLILDVRSCGYVSGMELGLCCWF